MTTKLREVITAVGIIAILWFLAMLLVTFTFFPSPDRKPGPN